MSYGAQFKFGIARQSAGATPVPLPANVGSYWGLPLVNESIGLEKGELISANLIGKFEQGAVYDGVNMVKGTIEIEVTPKSLLTLLAATVNWAPPAVSSGSLQTHTWMPNTVDYNSTYVKAPWTSYAQWTDVNCGEQMFDLQFGQLDFTIAQGQFLKLKATVNGGARTAAGVGSASIAADPADVGQLWPWNVCSISLGGNAMGAASSLTVSLNENIDALYTTNASLAPYKYTRKGFREVTVQGTFYMADRNVLNQFTGVTSVYQRLLVTLTSTKTAIQSGYFNTLVIDVPQLKITAFKPGVSGPGEVAVNVTGRGVIDPSSFYAIQLTTITTGPSGF